MSTNHIRRIDEISRWLKPRCTTCHGHAYALLIVPTGADETDPAWNPTHCPECGIVLQTVQKIIAPDDRDDRERRDSRIWPRSVRHAR